MLSLSPRALVGAVAIALAASLPAWAAPVELTILHTNDTHDHLESYAGKQGETLGGIARRATLFKQIKAKTPNVLVFDAGDCFQGTPIFTFFAGEADYKAMQQAGYDATTVGNHDLDNGLANLKKQAAHLDFPPLSCNLTDGDGKLLFPSTRLFEVGGLKIGVTGVTGENAYHAIAKAMRAGVTYHDPAPILRRVLPELRRQGADLTVVLSHSGLEEDLALAKAVEGIDVIVGGHSHTKVPKPIEVRHGDRATLVLQAFQWGEYVGRLDLTVDAGRIQSYHGELLPVTDALAPDPLVQQTVAGYAGAIAKQMDEVVGRSAVYFANERKAMGDAPIGNLVADVIREATGADVALMNSGGIRSFLPQGEITRGAVFSMLPFENRLVRFKADGPLVQEVADFVVAKMGGSGSLQVGGLTFHAKGGKATRVMVGGKPLDLRRTYTVATIDYLANANDGATVFTKVKAVEPTGQLVRDAFFAYLKKHPTLAQPQGGRIVVE